MRKILKEYNSKIREIIVVVIMFCVVLLILRILNYFSEKNLDKKNQEVIEDSKQVQNVYNPNETLLFGEENISKNDAQKYNKVLNYFLDACIEGKVQNAYSILSKDCKEELYPSLQSFEQNYYNNIFNNKKEYSYQNWYGSVYEISITDNLLATGGKSNLVKDYYTIISENEEDKLNINSFIGKEPIYTSKNEKNINIDLEYASRYMEYTIYHFKIKNDTGEDIILDSMDKLGTIYGISTNGVKFSAYKEELFKDSLKIENDQEKEISIKFSNGYSDTIIMKTIVFEDIILNNTQEKDNVISISVDL